MLSTLTTHYDFLVALNTDCSRGDLSWITFEVSSSKVVKEQTLLWGGSASEGIKAYNELTRHLCEDILMRNQNYKLVV